MTDTQTDTQETENVENSEGQELDPATVIEEMAAEEARATEEAAGTVQEGDFTPTDTQKELAKQLGFDDDYASNMTEAQAEAADQWGRKQSAYQQRRGKTKKEEPVSVESSTDEPAEDGGDFTEDDLYTPEGIARINKVMKDLAELKASDKKRGEKHQTSEQVRLQEGIDKVFDGLDQEVFAKFQPGETASIEPGSPVEALRNEVVSMAKAIQGASTEDISMEEALEQALSVVAPAETQQAALNKDNDRRETRGKQRLSTPSSTTQKHEKVYDNPHDKAIDEIHAHVNGIV